MNRKEFIQKYQLDFNESQLKAWFIKKNYLYKKGDKLSVSAQGHQFIKIKPVTFGDFIEIHEESSDELAKYIKK